MQKSACSEASKHRNTGRTFKALLSTAGVRNVAEGAGVLHDKSAVLKDAINATRAAQAKSIIFMKPNVRNRVRDHPVDR